MHFAACDKSSAIHESVVLFQRYRLGFRILSLFDGHGLLSLNAGIQCQDAVVCDSWCM